MRMSEKNNNVLRNLQNLAEKVKILETQVADLRLDKFVSDTDSSVTLYSFEALKIQNPHLVSHKNMFLVLGNSAVLFLKNAKLHTRLNFKIPSDVKVEAEMVIECGDEKLKWLVSDYHLELQSSKTFNSEFFSINLPSKKYLLINECEFKNG